MTVNSKFDGESHYYSGQGVVLVGERTALGKPKGLFAVGNVTALAIAITTSVLEHKESQTGQRATDLRITTETKATITFDLENYNAKNLALALRGDKTTVPAASATGEAIPIYAGKVSPLAHINVSAVVLTGLTAFVDDVTAYDYKVNLDAGSVQFNDSSSVNNVALGNGGVAVTAIAVGATTDLTVTAPLALVGTLVVLNNGFAGADAALLNGKTATVVTNTGTHVTININTVGKTITIGTGKVLGEGATVNAAYDYTLQYRVDALTQGSLERYLRFEGLNTADANSPVIVEAFKFLVDPLADRAFISDALGKLTMTGSLLIDSLQSSGSKFFKETMLIA